MPEEKKVIIHTMPKRFIGSRVITQGHKGIGIIIISLGALLMIGALAVLYIFVLKPKTEPIIQEIQENTEVNEPVKNNMLAENAVKEEEKNNIAIVATSTDIDNIENIVPVNDIKKIDINDITTSTDSASSTNNTEINNFGNVAKVLAPDSDHDGLSDIEEILLDCNINNADSDGDGYSDIDELMKLYNPAGAGKLIVNPNIEKYTNNSFKYSLYYPNTWLKTNVDEENSILFQAGNNQYIQIIVQNNMTGKGLDDWYKEQVGVNEIKGSQRMYKTGWSGIKSPDGLINYLANPNQNVIYTISYNTGMDNTLMYTAIFNMIVESLAVVN